MTTSAATLDDYLSDPHNQAIYQDIEEIGFKPLEFFNFFYRLVDLVKEGKGTQAIQELEGCEGGIRLYLLFSIRERLRDSMGKIAGWTVDDSYEASLFLIHKEYDETVKICPPDIFPPDPDNSIHDRARRAVAINSMTREVIGIRLKQIIEESRARAERDEAIELRARQDERERLEKAQSGLVADILKTVKQPRQNPEFTTNRQVIAVGLMLKALGATSIKKTTQANFIEFLTGKTNKEIYSRVGDETTVYNRNNSDGEYVRDWFIQLGLTDIAKEIDDLLSKKPEQF